MKKPKVLVADPISDRGVEELKHGAALEVIVRTGLKGEDLLKAVADVEGIVVRSQTKITADVIASAPLLKAVGRAGVGVDNVDVEAATRRGVVVMNTPGGNTISTAEHAFSLLMALARKIPQAHASVESGKWDRKSFEGVELNGKNLAILGMGRIGTEISRRAISFGMRVYAYDPYIAASRARSLQVELIEQIDDLLPLADFITLHMPLTPETYHMIDARRLQLTRRGVRIVNCARGGLIDEAALLEALKSGHVAGAALDVYEVEPPPADFALRGAPGMVFTPHLGASTVEAQESVGIEIADTMRALLLDGVIRNAVNMPNVDKRTLEAIGHYIAFGERLGRFLAQMAPRRCDALEITYRGPVNEYDTTPISRSILKGFLENVGGKDVNIVNAPGLATNLGMKVIEAKLSSQGDYTELLEISARQGETLASVAGTFFGATPRIVNVNGRFVEAKPEGTILMLENRDRPGIVGQVGTLLGEHAVNIAGMSLGRTEKGGRALTLLNLDTRPPLDLVERLYADPDIFEVRTLTL